MRKMLGGSFRQLLPALSWLLSVGIFPETATAQPAGNSAATAAPAKQPAPSGSAVQAPNPQQSVTTAAIPSNSGILRITSRRGEVLIDKGGNGASNNVPLREDVVLAKLDELTTNDGSIELSSPTGFSVRLGSGTLVALLSPNAVYLARGELHIVDRSPLVPGQSPPPFYVASPCGKSLIRARDATLRVDGNRAAVSVYAGTVYLGSASPSGAGVVAGQSAHCAKGEAVSSPVPLLPAPQWTSTGELLVIGDPGQPLTSPVRLQPLPGAVRYRVELSAIDTEAEVPLRSSIVSATEPPIVLPTPAVGRYLARAAAIDTSGAVGPESPPHPFVIARIAGLAADGSASAAAGSLPRITSPKGSTWSVLLDGAPPTEAKLTAGPHKLRLQIAGLAVDVPLRLAAQSAGPTRAAAPSPLREFQGDSTAVWIGPTAEPELPETPVAPLLLPNSGILSATAAVSAKPTVILPPRETPGAEDVLFGGVGEVPFDGVRSPWAHSSVGVRAETTVSGSLRVAAGGRFVMRNGFGFEASASLVRAAIATVPEGLDASGIGNLNAAVRTPRLLRKHIALQGLVAMVAPISTSFLDASVEQDPKYVQAGAFGTVLVPNVRPPGGGWRVEPAVLFGVRVRAFSISTLQGVSLRVSPEVGASYAGGLILHTEIIPALRCYTFAAWEVRYLGGEVNPAAQTPDRGGAVGGGLEALIAAGSRGSLRLAVLGRAGVGDGGEAVYGRGALGIQVGYLFH